ncbi:MAG TPA: tetratricopeptide repeat protein [Chitinophagales bacterium]|nr:tetratricopeptide repeat protein [Chitinophagales bacterium]
MKSKQFNISESEWEMIERHLTGKLSPQESSEFQNNLDHNSDYPQKINHVKDFIQGIEAAALLNKTNDWHQEMESPSVEKKSFSSRYMIAASIAFILAGISLWIILQPSPNEKLYTEFYLPDPGLPTVMSTSTVDYDFEKAMVDYKLGNFALAQEAWTQLLKYQPNNDTLQFFIGNALLAQDKNKEAIVYFENTIKKTNSNFYEDAQWYLGLAYLKAQDYEKAKIHVELSSHEDKELILNKIRGL